MSVRAIDADGRITVYEIGDLIGSGTGSYVYACRNVPGVVLKFPNEGISAADWLDEATRIDGLLNETGIRHLPILSVAPDAPIPFYVQARLPADARRFASAEGIVGYEITRPGTVVPVTATPDDLRALEAKGLVRLQFGYSLADGGVLPRPMQRALMRLYKRVGLADLAAEDLHLDNVYFVRQGLGWEAGILDLEYIGPWRQLPDVDPELAIKVLNIEQLSGKRMPVLLPSMAGKDYSAELRMLAEAGEERFYPDADFFMEKMLEYKWYIRYLPAEKRWIGSMVDLDIVQEYFPNFRQHVTPNLVDLADQRALGVPGPRVDVGLEPVPARPWPESVGPRGPPDPAATLDKAQPPVPSPKPVYDPYAPTAGRLGASPQASAAGPRPVPAVGISEDAIQRREPPDMVYGLYRKQPEGLPEWTRRRGGQTLEDIQEFRLEAAAMDLSHSLIGNRRRSVAGLVVAAEEGRQVHFDLNGMDPTAPWTPGHPNFDSVTSAELRHLRENWADFNPRPKFYLDGAEVRAPWLDLPTTPRPTPGGKPPPPRPPGSGGSVPQQSRPSGLTDPAPPEPPSERLADPQEFTLSTPRTPSTPAERQKLLEQELAARWGNQLRRDAAEEAKRQEEAIRLRPAQEAAFRFDVSALPVHRGTQPRNLNDSLAPVRQLVPGDTRYVGSIMSGAEHKPAQTYLYAHLVNHYVAQILAGGQFPSGGNGLRILIDANGVIQEGHHRYVAAQIVRRLTGRPLFTGPERIIPDTQVAFGAVVKAPKPETSWDKLSIRPPREEKR
jgi:hypothetical protein